ncbi:MAG: hypothetical protein ABII06_12100 [Pseudomonadota bacterium]
MKKWFVVVVSIFVALAFFSGAMAQDKAGAKPAKPKVMKASGTVSAYEADKSMTVKGAKKTEWTFDIKGAKLEGDFKVGDKVTVLYKKDGDKKIATAITKPKKKEKGKK